MAGTPDSTSKLPEERDVRLDYADFDFNRPPFCYPTDEEGYSPSPLYPEIDETDLYRMEKRVFNPEEFFPTPPEGLSPEHPLCKAWENLKMRKDRLERGITIIKNQHRHFQPEQSKIAETIKRLREQLGLKIAGVTSKQKTTEEKEKDMMEMHFKEKQLYFHQALAYLYVYKSHFENRTPSEVDDLFDETESSFIGHMAYPIVRSAVNKYNARRESGEMVMNHVYASCVHVMNRYLKRLQKEEAPEKRRELYRRMKIAMMAALGHDYLEDFREMSEEFLENKMTQHLTLDTTIEAPLKRSGYTNLPADTNPFSRERDTVLAILHILKKPPRGHPLRESYLQHRLFEDYREKSDEIRTLALEVKNGDRLHNVHTLGVKSAANQSKYFRETGNLIELGFIAQREWTNADFALDLVSLSEATLGRINQLQSDHETLEETTDISAEVALEKAYAIQRVSRAQALIKRDHAKEVSL